MIAEMQIRNIERNKTQQNNKFLDSFIIGLSINGQDDVTIVNENTTKQSTTSSFWNENNKTISEENESLDENSEFFAQSGNITTQNENISFNLISEREAKGHTILPNKDMKFNTGRWLQEEHQKFIEAMFLYGNEWKKVQQHIKTRSSTQARSHAQKFFIRLRKKFFENFREDELKNGSINSKNENLINLIKESVNCDLISNLFKIFSL